MTDCLIDFAVFHQQGQGANVISKARGRKSRIRGDLANRAMPLLLGKLLVKVIDQAQHGTEKEYFRLTD